MPYISVNTWCTNQSRSMVRISNSRLLTVTRCSFNLLRHSNTGYNLHVSIHAHIHTSYSPRFLPHPGPHLALPCPEHRSRLAPALSPSESNIRPVGVCRRREIREVAAAARWKLGYVSPQDTVQAQNQLWNSTHNVTSEAFGWSGRLKLWSAILKTRNKAAQDVLKQWQGYFRKKYSGSLLSPLFGYFWAWLLFGYLLVISWLIFC